MLTHILAFFCRVCPFCICARRWPESRFARALAAVEKRCPACRAYRKLHGTVSQEEGAHD